MVEYGRLKKGGHDGFKFGSGFDLGANGLPERAGVGDFLDITLLCQLFVIPLLNR